MAFTIADILVSGPAQPPLPPPAAAAAAAHVRLGPSSSLAESVLRWE